MKTVAISRCVWHFAQSTALLCSQKLNIVKINSSQFLLINRSLSTIPQKKSSESTVHHVLKTAYSSDSWTNVSPSVLSKIEHRLHLQQNHPLAILKTKIEDYMLHSQPSIYKIIDSMVPVVSPKQNFDDLLIGPDHPGRLPTDTYYLNRDNILRTHTSAHQSTVLASKSSEGYLLTADVYRRDEVDQTHYPVFHQMEGIRTFDRRQFSSSQHTAAEAATAIGISENKIQSMHTPAEVMALSRHLKDTLENLIRCVFADEPNLQWRWNEDYFPFTSPSWELEVFYNGKWLELFGCGVVRQEIMNNSGNSDRVAWAFGLGLERIAMPLFNIPDIRLFWSTDPRFTSQFMSGKMSKFKPFSKYPSCYKDISFWIPSWFHENDFFEVVRDVAGDLAEEVKLVDEFKHPKTSRTSHCYRINYRSMDKTCTNAEIDITQEKLRIAVVQQCGVELR
ncbi:hypothetical protein BATDEDRAFT_35022 [Batrachochytrium dendrobatidis JAM81]|uniref:Phenylalanine--tRNA ligase, mitochondrial n=2 Tax=Batrachochytrium dendrobatidis TaxID=109871 RepID=F4P216_BATDJ|nr:phenylalanine--tRNA ligase [Batrachochytrium dendrobatidis JAM81]EGF80780.1 hypothetical protein BATDEDRAFT_35022 [Batrachochytrium dendrobatidis JAM81]OAJ41912.1 phenylalanine-tRNA ligase [Batrachochytrium dendrobatidis JEL423]|eukprot:XP_006678590.1 hypothetical protein BATDEDRAFT_35022 [Batrachochytrium dendrobatidis JAM81]